MSLLQKNNRKSNVGYLIHSSKPIPNIRILKWITSDYDKLYKYKDIFIEFLNF